MMWLRLATEEARLKAKAEVERQLLERQRELAAASARKIGHED